jgi:hypothetical protein
LIRYFSLENAQRNTAAMTQQYEALKQWKTQELERQQKIKTQYSQAKDISAALREENMKLKHKQEHLERTARTSEVCRNF